MGFLSKLFGKQEKKDLKTLVQQGAVILDVRTPQEFKSGHIPGAINIPVQQLQQQLHRLKKDKVIITCCASGARSAMARSILKQAGFAEVYNGGSWMRLHNQIR
ncbi:MAG: rhodanese-like domain-containing protein [Thermoflavifilum aggregans]|nr:rhodanese-like domain-containing protein [Thermoflavifilum aggregans]